MHVTDLFVAWTWPPDEPVVRLIETRSRDRGLTCRSVGADSIEAITSDSLHGRSTFRWLLDRASDEHSAFTPLALWVEGREGAGSPWPRALNPYHRQKRASDKATMHLELMSAGVHVPHTIILPPYDHEPEVQLDASAIASLGGPFVIKPANTTGGGNGVITGVTDIDQIAVARESHPHDKYLLQETIHPMYMGDYRGWFRVFFACGNVHLCWWDDRTHVYESVASDDERFFGLGKLRSVAEAIAAACGLRFFSTELVITSNDQVVAVDYVNEVCDLRLQSTTRNGVPDAIVLALIDDILTFVQSGSAGQGVIP